MGPHTVAADFVSQLLAILAVLHHGLLTISAARFNRQEQVLIQQDQQSLMNRCDRYKIYIS